MPFGFPPPSSLPQFRSTGPTSGIPTAGAMPQGMHVFMDMAPGLGVRVPFGMPRMLRVVGVLLVSCCLMVYGALNIHTDYYYTLLILVSAITCCPLLWSAERGDLLVSCIELQF